MKLKDKDKIELVGWMNKIMIRKSNLNTAD
jgi:hypothetical protein